MKNLLTACLPAFALLALGGCAGTSALTSSEDDGVYYSSKDRTSMVVRQAPASAPASTDEAANPDYNGNISGTTARQNSQSSGSDQYYDNNYTYMRGVPSYSSATFYGPGVSYYSPYSPYTSLGYGGVYGMSPFGYDPFYSPYYGYGSGLSISFGFGRPWGYGGGYGYGYSPFGYGYGGGFYDPYYYNSRFYGGYYGGGGYYGNNYYGGNYHGNNYYGGGYADNNGRGRTSGRRSDRTSEGRSVSNGGGVTSPGTVGATGNGGGRVRSEMVAPSNNTPQSMPNGIANEAGRVRSADTRVNSSVVTDQPAGDYRNRPRQMDAVAKPRYRDMDPATINAGAQPMQEQVTRGDSRGRGRTADAQPQNMPDQMQPAASQPQDGQRRRGGFFQNIVGEPINNNTGRAADAAQPRQRTYDQPRQQTYSQPQQRTYEQPQQRTYEQPQRSYEQPQRSSQPSYSAPSYGGGGGGGGGGRSRGRGE